MKNEVKKMPCFAHLLQQDQGALGVLQRTLVAAELTQHRARVEMCVGRVVHLLEPSLNLEGLLEVLQAGVELPLAAVVARQVVEGDGPSGRVTLCQNFGLLQEFQYHCEVLDEEKW